MYYLLKLLTSLIFIFFYIVFNAIDTTINSLVIIKKIINGASSHRVYEIAENEIKNYRY